MDLETPKKHADAAVSVSPQIAARLRSTQVRAAMRAHARTEVADRCRACGEPIEAQRSTRRFCSSACRLTAWRYEGRRPLPIAHQRRVRDAEASRDPRPTMTTLEGCTVTAIPFAEAKALVVRYEWLGSMPATPKACYGLKDPSGELVGVACFDRGPAPESADLCGSEYRSRTICLARGACVHWAHPHAASFLISRACKLAHKQFGWTVFYAYADPMAGEIGIVYQACNWLYLGVGTRRNRGGSRPRFFNRREGKWCSERVLYKRQFTLAELRAHPDWIADKTPDKGRYVHFEGTRSEKRDLAQALKYPPQPFPKRRRPSARQDAAGRP